MSQAAHYLLNADVKYEGENESIEPEIFFLFLERAIE